MLQLSIGMHRKNPGFEVKAIVGVHKAGATKQETKDNLKAMHSKLEQIIPGVHKAKYNMNNEEMIVSIKEERAADAQRTLHKLDEYIKSAATSLKLK